MDLRGTAPSTATSHRALTPRQVTSSDIQWKPGKNLTLCAATPKQGIKRVTSVHPGRTRVSRPGSPARFRSALACYVGRCIVPVCQGRGLPGGVLQVREAESFFAWYV